MKLLVLLGVLGLGWGRPQTTQQGEISEGELSAFMDYLRAYQRIFANEDNHQKLQELFDEPKMREFISATLDPNRGDQRLTMAEMDGWYPQLQQLWERLGMEPVVQEEWVMADMDKDGEVTPREIYLMLRDGTAGKFFPSFMSLIVHEATKAPVSPFWNAAKKARFEQSPFAQIIALAPVSDDELEKTAQEIEAAQGSEAKQAFEAAMGMDSDEAPTVTVQSSAGPAKIPVEASSGKKPVIKPETVVTTTSGKQLPAGDLDETAEEVAPGSAVSVTMPDGSTVIMPAAVDQEDNDEPQPTASITSSDGRTMEMPVVDMKAKADGTSTSTILTPTGSTVEVDVAPSSSSVHADDDESAEKESVMKAGGQEVPVQVTSVSKVDDDSAIVTLAAKDGSKITTPILTEKKDEVMVLTNTATGETLTGDVEKVEHKADGTTLVTASTTNGQTITAELPAKADNDDALGTNAAAPEGTLKVTDSKTKAPIAQGEITQSDTVPNSEGGKTTVLNANMNGTPFQVEIKDEKKSATTTKTVEIKQAGQPATEVPVVAEDDETVTAELADGTKITAPKEPKASTDGDETVAGGEVKDKVVLTNAQGNKAALPITEVKKEQNPLTKEVETKMTVITPTGAAAEITIKDEN